MRPATRLAQLFGLTARQVHRALRRAELEDVSEEQIDQFTRMLEEVFTALIGSGVGEQAELAELALEMEPHGVAFAAALEALAERAELVESRWQSPNAGGQPYRSV